MGKTIGYARLSRDDGDDESTSIFNQKRIIEEFAKQQGFHIDKFYIDDGFSGFSMDRPDFNRLKEALNNNEVDTIIVKNLSRLGRHNAGVQFFLENIEEDGKRVISIDERYDTHNEASHDMVGITTWVNEKYIKDTSRNVRRAIAIMQKEGRYISNVPYGYELDPFKKGEYHIDETCAMYVKEIFELYLSGLGMGAIARMFTDRGVPNSTTIIKQRLERRGQVYKGSFGAKWSPGTILGMLRNDFYIGTLTLGKTKRRTINGKAVWQPEEKLLKFEDAHEPIIDKRTFRLVQEMIIERSTSHYRGDKNKVKPKLFVGKLYCADCGQKMTSTSSRNDSYIRYVCKTYNLYGTKHCSSHVINDRELKEAFLIFLGGCRDNLVEAIEDLDSIIKKEHNKSSGNTIDVLEKDLERANKEVKVLLEQKMRDIMSNPAMSDIINNTYTSMINDKYNQIKSLTTQLEDSRKNALNGNEIRKDLGNALRIFDDIINTKNINRRQIASIVDRIVVYEDGGADFYLKGDLHELCTNYIMCKKTNKTLVLEATIEYIKKHPDHIVMSKALKYVRLLGCSIGNDHYSAIFQTLVDKGYLVKNEGYLKGHRVVDLEKLINDSKFNNVIGNAPRVHNNIVTYRLIVKIQRWVKGMLDKRKTLF
jgi:DNA invertase Pin-like site-specific DNA recombinase